MTNYTWPECSWAKINQVHQSDDDSVNIKTCQGEFAPTFEWKESRTWSCIDPHPLAQAINAHGSIQIFQPLQQGLKRNTLHYVWKTFLEGKGMDGEGRGGDTNVFYFQIFSMLEGFDVYNVKDLFLPISFPSIYLPFSYWYPTDRIAILHFPPLLFPPFPPIRT